MREAIANEVWIVVAGRRRGGRSGRGGRGEGGEERGAGRSERGDLKSTESANGELERLHLLACVRAGDEERAREGGSERGIQI